MSLACLVNRVLRSFLEDSKISLFVDVVVVTAASACVDRRGERAVLPAAATLGLCEAKGVSGEGFLQDVSLVLC